MAERKKFIDIEIPILKQTIQALGTNKSLKNKTIKLDLSRKMRGKGVIITLQIFNKDEKLIAAPKKIELINSYLRKIIRKRTDNVEGSFQIHCSDIRATIKPFLITRKKVSRAVRNNLRNTSKEFISTYTKEKTYNEIAEEILDGTLQKAMLPKLKKVYPLAFCDIRVFETKDLNKIDINSIIPEEDLTEIEKVKKEIKKNETSEENLEQEVEENIEEEKEKTTKKKTSKKTKKNEDSEENAIKE